MKTTDVVVAGELYVDLILSGFDRWPQPGHESFAREFAKESGGGAAITASGLAKLGLNTQILGVVGADDSEWLLGRLRESRVDTSMIQLHDSEPTAFTVVASTAEDRAFLTYAGANKALPAALRHAAKHSAFSDARHVHLAYPPNLDTAVDLLASLHRNGCTLSLDVGWHPEWLDDPRATSLLRHVDLFFPNEVEGLRMTRAANPEKALQRFADAGALRVAMKLGPRGATLLWDGETLSSEAPHVNPVDTTGAGDCFDAGFLYAWLRGRSPQQCLQAANLCGALSTEARGGIAGFPSIDKLTELWR